MKAGLSRGVSFLWCRPHEASANQWGALIQAGWIWVGPGIMTLLSHYMEPLQEECDLGNHCHNRSHTKVIQEVCEFSS